MSDLLVAIGLLLAIEGALYALAPNLMRRMMSVVFAQPEQQLRIAGVVAAVVGVGIVWAVRG